MRHSDIREFSNRLENITIDPDIIQSFSRGMEWCDIPFPNLKSVEYYGFDLWSGHRKPDRVEKYHSFGFDGEYLIFEEIPNTAPNWMRLLILIDKVVGRAGDLHHNYFSGFDIKDNRLRVHMDS
jgi:hypothetical protein